MTRRLLLLALTLVPVFAADPLAEMARAKLALIEDDKATPGSVITFTSQELNAWIRAELAEEPQVGMRETKLELGEGTVSFEALADFQKLASGQGGMFATLLAGERKVKLVVQPETTAGKVTVKLKLLEISGVPLTGILLNLAAKLVMSQVYDEVQVDQPFEMGHNIDHAVIEPTGLRVYIKK
ncbi:MAG: hypothetical protein ABIR70_17050 [Bryobacteraceae bacterium]